MTSQPNTSETYDVVIVGGGIAGLTVAYQLGNQNVLLLEKEDMCGGRTLSTNIGPYVFNQGAQMIPGGETNVAKLADELGLTRTLIDKTKTSTYMKGKFVAGSSDFRFLLGLPIPLFEKLKMALELLGTGALLWCIANRKSGIVDKVDFHLSRLGYRANGCYRARGFSTSVRASPSRFQDKSSVQATTPGPNSIHGTSRRALMLLASSSIFPEQCGTILLE